MSVFGERDDRRMHEGDLHHRLVDFRHISLQTVRRASSSIRDGSNTTYLSDSGTHMQKTAVSPVNEPSYSAAILDLDLIETSTYPTRPGIDEDGHCQSTTAQCNAR